MLQGVWSGLACQRGRILPGVAKFCQACLDALALPGQRHCEACLPGWLAANGGHKGTAVSFAGEPAARAGIKLQAQLDALFHGGNVLQLRQ
jgi:hypothetical protein